MAGSTTSNSLQLSRPMSVVEISQKALDFEFNPSIALKYWLRTANTLYQEAAIYQHERNDQQAFLLLWRYVSLVTEQFPNHPECRNPELRPGLKEAQRRLNDVLTDMELLKPRINARYDKWQKIKARQRETHASDEGRRNDPAASDPAVAGNRTTLAAAENSALAVKLAHNEIRRRETKRRAVRPGTTEQEEQVRRTAGIWDDWEAALNKKAQPDNVGIDDEMRRNMEETRRRMDGPHDLDGARRHRLTKPVPRASQSNSLYSPSNDYNYPSIPKPQASKPGNSETRSRSRSRSPRRPHLPPKPPKERFDEPPMYNEVPPPEYYEPPPRPDKTAPDFEDRSMTPVEKSGDYTFEPSAYLENGKPLRTIFLPEQLRQKFLQIAAANTRNNLETCGMLCGTLVSNALFISQLVIPEQVSTSDTCETTNEGAFFDYCASEDLMVLGWIHTHPSQTCFMSSRDLHTHCGYQIMMPESIAIVCAPSKSPAWGIFRLTDPPGMQSVLNCRKEGLFHPHEEKNIYTDAVRPMGHVMSTDGLHFKVVDMRPK